MNRLQALFAAMTEALADLDDLRDLRAAKAEEAQAATMTLKEAQERYGAK